MKLKILHIIEKSINRKLKELIIKWDLSSNRKKINECHFLTLNPLLIFTNNHSQEKDSVQKRVIEMSEVKNTLLIKSIFTLLLLTRLILSTRKSSFIAYSS